MKISTAEYFITESLNSIRRNGLMSLASLMTVALSLLILGVFIILVMNLNHMASVLESQVQVTVYLQDTLKEVEVREIGTRITKLPGVTRVCCAHEYTLSNLKFARAVEPGNEPLLHYNNHCETLRSQNLPTLPSNMALERQINPFLRVRHHTVAHAAQAFDAQVHQDDAVAVLAALRQWKNEFR